MTVQQLKEQHGLTKEQAALLERWVELRTSWAGKVTTPYGGSKMSFSYLTDGEIEQAAFELGQGRDHISKEADKLGELTSPAKIVKWVQDNKLQATEAYPSLFADGESRIRIPLDEDTPLSSFENGEELLETLKKLGYEHVDLQTMRATKNKQPVNLSKLVCLAGSRVETLLSKWKDMLGSRGGQLVISRDPYDIGTASTLKPWTSCTSLDKGFNNEHLPEWVRTGVLVAYVYGKSDPQCLNPIGRKMLFPYENSKGERALHPAQKFYGLGNSPLVAGKLKEFSDKFNHGKQGEFKIVPNYHDTEQQTIEIGADPMLTDEEWLDDAKIPYYRHPNGTLVVCGNVTNARFPFTKPTTIIGSITCSKGGPVRQLSVAGKVDLPEQHIHDLVDHLPHVKNHCAFKAPKMEKEAWKALVKSDRWMSQPCRKLAMSRLGLAEKTAVSARRALSSVKEFTMDSDHVPLFVIGGFLAVMGGVIGFGIHQGNLEAKANAQVVPITVQERELLEKFTKDTKQMQVGELKKLNAIITHEPEH